MSIENNQAVQTVEELLKELALEALQAEINAKDEQLTCGSYSNKCDCPSCEATRKNGSYIINW